MHPLINLYVAYASVLHDQAATELYRSNIRISLIHEDASKIGTIIDIRTPPHTNCSSSDCQTAADDRDIVRSIRFRRKEKQDLVNSKFSIVLQGFQPRRIPNYERIFNEYGRMKNDVDKIILVWDNMETDPPLIPKNLLVNVVIVRSSANRITDRYNVVDMLRTAAVFSVDDDVLLSPALMRCMFQYWRQDPSRLVGVDEDIRDVSPSGKYVYPKIGEPYSIVLTKSMVYNIRYLDMFFNDTFLPKTANAMMTGEDIGMNALVENITRKPPLAVKLDSIHNRRGLNDDGGLGDQESYAWWIPSWVPECLPTWLCSFLPKENTAGQGRDKFSQIMLSYFGNHVFRTRTAIAQCSQSDEIRSPTKVALSVLEDP